MGVADESLASTFAWEARVAVSSNCHPVGNVLMAVAAWLVVYIAVCGSAGFAIARKTAPFCVACAGVADPAGCVPRRGLFDVIETSCANPIAGAGWFIALGLPRLFIVGPGVVVGVILELPKRGLRADDLEIASGAMVASLPLATIASSGLLYWRRRNRLVGAVAAALLVSDLCCYVMLP